MRVGARRRGRAVVVSTLVMVVVLGVLGLWVITAGESRHPAPSPVLDLPRVQRLDPEQSELRPADVDFGPARTR